MTIENDFNFFKQTQQNLVKSAEKLSEMPEADATKLYESNTFHYLLTYMRHLDFNGLRKVADFALLGLMVNRRKFCAN